MKAFLMFAELDFDLQAQLPQNEPELSQDLELDTLLGAMSAGDRFMYDVAKLAVLSPLSDPDAIRFRQAVLADCLAAPAVLRRLYQLGLDAIAGERKFWSAFQSSPQAILSRSVQVLEFFLGMLKELRAIADENQQRFRSDGFRRFFTMIGDELDDGYFELVERHLAMLRFKQGTLISARLGAGDHGTGYVLRAQREQRWIERLTQFRRSGYSFQIDARDVAGMNAYEELNDRGLNLVANALAQSAEHIKSFFLMLVTELAFYLGALNLHERLAENHDPTCMPEPLPAGAPKLSARGLYDVCLALRLDGGVVGNDLDADGKALVMITGANQGGKSTFLRSLGLAQLMMQSGMFVAADGLRADVRERVFTHCKREEDSSMESGKLDEELARLSRIADQITPTSMLLANESFSSTNEREGSEIGRQVTTAMIDTGVKLVYVTHLYDLAHQLHSSAREDILFLRAPRGESGQRTFKLEPGTPLPTSYGQDTYQQIFDPHATRATATVRPSQAAIAANGSSR